MACDIAKIIKEEIKKAVDERATAREEVVELLKEIVIALVEVMETLPVSSSVAVRDISGWDEPYYTHHIVRLEVTNKGPRLVEEYGSDSDPENAEICAKSEVIAEGVDAIASALVGYINPDNPYELKRLVWGLLWEVKDQTEEYRKIKDMIKEAVCKD